MKTSPDYLFFWQHIRLPFLKPLFKAKIDSHFHYTVCVRHLIRNIFCLHCYHQRKVLSSLYSITMPGFLFKLYVNSHTTKFRGYISFPLVYSSPQTFPAYFHSFFKKIKSIPPPHADVFDYANQSLESSAILLWLLSSSPPPVVTEIFEHSLMRSSIRFAEESCNGKCKTLRGSRLLGRVPYVNECEI